MGDDYDSDKSVDEEFAELDELAVDAAATAAVWSFGLGMAAFTAMEMGAMLATMVASIKSHKLHKKMERIDRDISKKIGHNVDNWVKLYKQNNSMIAAKKNSAIDGAHARAILLKFIATIVRKEGKDKITPDRFRTYANSCRLVLKDETNINAVYDALDTINLSGQQATDAEIAIVMEQLNIFGLHNQNTAMTIVKTITLGYMVLSLNIVRKRIKGIAKEKGMEVNDLETSAIKEMETMEKFSVAVGCMVAVVDTVFQVYGIVEVVDQTKKLVKEINGSIKQQYKDFFNGIRTSSIAYKKTLD